MTEFGDQRLRVWASLSLRCVLIAVVSFFVAACDSKKSGAPETFVRDGQDNPRIGFVEVPDKPVSSPDPQTSTPDKPEPDPTPETAGEPEDDGASADSNEVRPSSPRGPSNGVGLQNIGTQSVVESEGEPKRRVKARRMGLSKSKADTSGNEGAEKQESAPRPLVLQRSRKNDEKSKELSPVRDDDEAMIPVFGDSGASDGTSTTVEAAEEPADESWFWERSANPKIEKANDSVDNEVTFFGARESLREKDPEWLEKQRRLARLRAKRRRERAEKARKARHRQIRKQAIEEALARPKPAPSATSTFAMDVDTGSYTLTGRKLARGQIPSADEIRVEEFINFFNYDYPEAEGAFGLTVEGAPSPFRADPHVYLMRFGVKARALTEAERRPQHITLVFDVSHSMDAADAMPIAKKSALALFDALDPEDTVSVIGYASRARLIASKVPVAQRDKLALAMSRLGVGSASGLQNALEVAYEHAIEHASANINSRVMLFSDGATGVDEIDGERMARELDEYRESQVGMVVLGVGAEIYNDAVLEAIANRSDGRYHHVNAVPEALRLFGEELDATLYTVAEDAKIQVSFESDTVKSFRKIGYDNRSLPDEFFRRDDVDAGEVGAGESVTALYEVEVHPGAEGELGQLRVRFNEPGGDRGKELAAGFRTADLAESFSSASDDLRFAASLAAFGEILQRSALAYSLDVDKVIEVADRATGDVAERKSAVYLMRRLLEVTGAQ